MKYAAFIGKLIHFVIRYAPIIMVIVEALKMVQTEIKKISENATK